MTKQRKTTVKRKTPGNKYILWFPDDRPEDKIQEALSVAGRRKLSQRMIRVARKMEVARKKARAKFAPDKNLKLRAQKLARKIFRKRIGGARGQKYSKLGMADKVALDKMVDKQAPAVKKMVMRLFPAVKRAESQRLAHMNVGSDNKQDKRHKKKHMGAKIQHPRKK